MKKNQLLIFSNCPNYEYLGSGYVINRFKIELEKYYHVHYYDATQYELFKFFKGRATIYRQSLGKLILLVRLYLKGERYQVIEFWGGDSFLAILFAKLAMRKALLVHHSNGLESKYVPILQKLNGDRKWFQLNLQPLYNITINCVHGVVTMTNHEAKWVMEQYAKKSVGIPAGLYPLFRNLMIDFKKKEDIIGFVGTWLPKKGIASIKSEIPIILRKYPTYRLQLIGVGEAEVILKQFPEDIHPQLEIIPFIKNKMELLAYYLKMRIFILPSKAESFGIVTIEAMASGCAVVASNIGYVADLCNKQEVLKLDESIEQPLQQALHELLSNQELLSTLAINGYHKVQELDWEVLGKQLATLYEEWLLALN